VKKETWPTIESRSLRDPPTQGDGAQRNGIAWSRPQSGPPVLHDGEVGACPASMSRLRRVARKPGFHPQSCCHRWARVQAQLGGAARQQRQKRRAAEAGHAAHFVLQSRSVCPYQAPPRHSVGVRRPGGPVACAARRSARGTPARVAVGAEPRRRAEKMGGWDGADGLSEQWEQSFGGERFLCHGLVEGRALAGAPARILGRHVAPGPRSHSLHHHPVPASTVWSRADALSVAFCSTPNVCRKRERVGCRASAGIRTFALASLALRVSKISNTLVCPRPRVYARCHTRGDGDKRGCWKF